MNYKLSLTYNGANFHGWNVQPNLRTVQGEILNVIESLFKLKPVIHASGRTDAGVHAINQVINITHKDLNLKPDVLLKALSSRIPKDLFINELVVVDDSFHARYSAQNKTYVYLINVHPKYDAINYQTIYQYNKTLPIAKINTVKKIFIGKHDFLSFSTSDLTNTVRTINNIEISEFNHIIKISINANGFLRSMVRMIVATIIAFCEQKIDIDTIIDCLDNPAKGKIRFKAPACGLYLTAVYYK